MNLKAEINRISRYKDVLEKRSKDEGWGWWIGFVGHAADLSLGTEWRERDHGGYINNPTKVCTDEEMHQVAVLLEYWTKYTRGQMARVLRHILDLDGFPRPTYPVYVNNVSCLAKDRKAEATRWEVGTNARLKYPCSPWTMQELVGSQWRARYTGDLAIIRGMGVDRSGHPQLYYGDKPHWDDWGRTLGLWSWPGERRYVVDSYVRVDHLTPEQQLEWMLVEIAECANSAWKKPFHLIDPMRDFAAANGITVTPEMLNIGFRQSAEPVQMMLL